MSKTLTFSSLVPYPKTFSRDETRLLRRWAVMFSNLPPSTEGPLAHVHFFKRFFAAYLGMFPVERTPGMDREEHIWLVRKREGVSSRSFTSTLAYVASSKHDVTFVGLSGPFPKKGPQRTMARKWTPLL